MEGEGDEIKSKQAPKEIGLYFSNFGANLGGLGSAKCAVLKLYIFLILFDFI